MVVFKFWRDMSLLSRALLPSLLSIVCCALIALYPAPLWNLLLVFSAFIAISAWIRYIYNMCGGSNPFEWLNRAWSILITFTFITFTRLFFRSGSNLDPAVANEVAWNIAKEMINSIGTQWDVNVWDVVSAYHNIFLLFILGMIIHWLPSNTKRRYRICFAKLPLPVMACVVVLVVFVCYQFITSEMQPFIYFQF